MLKLLLSTSFFLLMMVCQAQTFEEALKEARENNKQLLLIFSGSDWCKPCINFKSQVLETETFKAYAEEYVILFTADLPRNEKIITSDQLNENRQLAATYNKDGAFPYLVLFSSHGNLKRVRKGAFKQPRELIEWLEK